jgi:hypothetical protein
MAPRAGYLLLFYWFGYFQVKIGNNSVVFELGEEFRGLKSRFWSIETAFFISFLPASVCASFCADSIFRSAMVTRSILSLRKVNNRPATHITSPSENNHLHFLAQ